MIKLHTMSSTYLNIDMREIMITAAVDFYERTGRFPTTVDWTIKNGFPSCAKVATREFGNWSKLRVACGVQPTNFRAHDKIELSKLIIDAAQRFIETNGRFPTIHEFQMKDGFPCCFDTVLSLFNSVNEFKQVCRWSDRYTVETDRDMLKWIKSKCQIDDCWNWQIIDASGYGTIRWQGHIWRTHRLVYTLTHGTIPTKLVIRHRCYNKSCCNPDHLVIGSQQQNVIDSIPFRRKSLKKIIYKPKGLIGQPLIIWLDNVVEKINGCWEYPGVTVNGYPKFRYNNISYFFHRYVCAITHNLDYNGYFIARHTCHNKRCVNPEHLIPGTRSQNAIDSRAHNRRYRLTEDLVISIRGEWNSTDLRPMEFCKKWALETGTTPHAIHKIIQGKTWADVEAA